MARPLPVEYPGAYYHVINRGNNKEQIFNNKAREVAIYISRDMTGITCKDLGEYFGWVSGALITMMHNRIADESKRNKRLKGRINNIRNQIFSRVEPRCSGYRHRRQFHRFPGRPQSGSLTFLPLVPSSNRTSGFPRYGSPTTFPISLSVTVVVELQQLTELV